MISQLKEATPDGGQRTGGHRGSVAMAEVAIERETKGETKGGFEAPSAAPSIRPPPKLAAEARRAAPSVRPPPRAAGKGGAALDRARAARASKEKKAPPTDAEVVKEAVAILERQPSLRNSSSLTPVEVIHATESAVRRASSRSRGVSAADLLKLTSWRSSVHSSRSSLSSPPKKQASGFKMTSIDAIPSTATDRKSRDRNSGGAANIYSVIEEGTNEMSGTPPRQPAHRQGVPGLAPLGQTAAFAPLPPAGGGGMAPLPAAAPTKISLGQLPGGKAPLAAPPSPYAKPPMPPSPYAKAPPKPPSAPRAAPGRPGRPPPKMPPRRPGQGGPAV